MLTQMFILIIQTDLVNRESTEQAVKTFENMDKD